MTLHDAIEFIINEKGVALTVQEITDAINSTGLYTREDKEPVTFNQVMARINNTPLLFDITDNGLVFLKKDMQIQYERLVYKLQDLLRSYNSRYTDIIIATYVFIERVQEVYYNYTATTSSKVDPLSVRRTFALQNTQYATGFTLTREDEALIVELFQNLPPELEKRIASLLNSYDFSLKACSHRQFGAFFNNLLSSSSITIGALGDFATPAAVIKIITEFADIKEGQSVFDPFGGNAGLFCDIFRTKMVKFNLRLNDIDKYKVWLGKMNLVVNNFTQFEYDCNDSVSDYIFEKKVQEKFDWIITHPPFAVSLSKDILRAFHNPKFGSSSKFELVFLEMVLGQLKSTGKAIVIVPESFLFVEDKAFVRARQFLVENSLLKMVISLPGRAFLPFTSAKASILLIDKDDQKSDEPVKFIELNEELFRNVETNSFFSIKESIEEKNIISRSVFKAEIRQQKFSLVVNRYLFEGSQLFSNDYKKLRELITDKFSGKTYSQKVLNRNSGVPYINIKDLSDEKKVFSLLLNNIDVFVDTQTFAKTAKHVSRQAILIAKIGNKLKPTLNSTDSSIAVSGNILVLVPNKEIVSPVYLLSQFYEDYVLEQVNRIRGGAAQPFVKVDDFLDIYIKVPPLNEQHRTEMLFTLDQMENIPTRDLKEGSSVKEEINLSSAIKHEYKNLKNPLSSNISNLKDFFARKVDTKEALNWDDNIAINEGARTIKAVFADINDLMSEMSSLIDDIVTVVNLDKKEVLINKKEVSALSFFEKVAKKIQNEFPEIQLQLNYIDRKVFNNVRISVDDNLFFKVIRNFTLNSLKHGYEETVREKPVYIFLSITEDQLSFQIDLINDGKPFDTGFSFSDFVSFGKKTGLTKGSGIGGFIMNQIIVHHMGTFEMISENSTNEMHQRLQSLMKTGVHFKITLPIVK